MQYELRKLVIFISMAVFLVTAHASDPATDLIAKGDRQWSAGKLDDAQKFFDQAVKENPRSVEAYMKKAGLQLARNDFDGCIQTYQRAVGLEPKNVRAWMGLGFSYLHTGRHELSRAAFDEAIRIEPGRKEQLAPVLGQLNIPD